MTRNKSERGQSLVELAISITILAWFLAGAVEFGIAFFQFIQLRDAAQEGALYGSLNPADTPNIESRVRGSSSSPVDLTIEPPDLNAVTVTITVFDKTTGNPKGAVDACPGDGLQVKASYNHKIFMPFATLFTGGSTTIPLNAQVTDTILTSANPACF